MNGTGHVLYSFYRHDESQEPLPMLLPLNKLLQLEYSASSKAAEQYTADHLTSLRFDFTCFAVTCMPLFRPTPLLFSALALLIVKLKDRTATATIEGYWRWILPVLGASRPCGTTMPSLLEHLLKAYFSSNMEPTLILP
jgi:hypothetical protein